ncbi:helix-turn-helix domain-containing protein [Metabacillus malikii]|uniref:DNA-binding transcriptional regulator YiaG n=1 Tax=Metabacillus malikii TaxID=1504265 RepID=A0ABT9ZM91_9BACI|nr:helix-turn-helix transcriptional regulator [Metabacillus malikii]MDQ0233029.1 DNA-binding transcriptional regulator YiaG [Metabacillus malikii]
MEITPNMLKIIRGSTAHSQLDMANALGYSLSMIAKVEQNKRKLSNQAVLRLLHVYELNTEKLEQISQAAAEYKRAGIL